MRIKLLLEQKLKNQMTQNRKYETKTRDLTEESEERLFEIIEKKLCHELESTLLQLENQVESSKTTNMSWSNSNPSFNWPTRQI